MLVAPRHITEDDNMHRQGFLIDIRKLYKKSMNQKRENK